MVTALAMTEPDAGSDFAAIRTAAIRTDGGWVVNGQKTFITNGIHASHYLLAAKTTPSAGRRGISLFFVEDALEGFSRGRKLDKVGQKESDTAELFFSDMFVHDEDLVGELDRGFYHLMEGLSQERLSWQSWPWPGASRDLGDDRRSLSYPRGVRRNPWDLQHVRFVLAELASEIDIARVYIDRCIEEHNAGALTGVDAAKAKYWTTELQRRVTDRCLQLHGGTDT